MLSGECLLVVEGEERLLRAWDFVHCPPGTEHVFVGAGDGPCVIFMTGARTGERQIVYPRSEPRSRTAPASRPRRRQPHEAYERVPALADPSAPIRSLGRALPWAASVLPDFGVVRVRRRRRRA